MGLMRIFLGLALTGVLLVGGLGDARGATAVLNISCGYLLDEAGISAADRAGEGTLCVLVADLAGDGFDAPGTGWVADDDVLVVVSDSEFPATLPGGGTRGFDLASGVTEPGLFSRSLVVDLSQFAGRTAPVPVALRWFPGLKAAEVEVSAAGGGPPTGTAYGEFSRAVPLYPESGSTAWVIPLGGGGENVTLDPLATAELGGKDAALLGSASRRTGTSGGGTPPSGVVLALNPGGTVTVSFSGGAGLKYKVQRSVDLLSWPVEWTVTADGQGAGTLTDSAPPAGRAFYRVAGPMEPCVVAEAFRARLGFEVGSPKKFTDRSPVLPSPQSWDGSTGLRPVRGILGTNHLCRSALWDFDHWFFGPFCYELIRSFNCSR